jgi:hypothetical protein
MTWPKLGLSLLVLALGTEGVAEEKKRVPVYTNDDLDRLAPYRDQTGVSSPAVTEALPPDRPGSASAGAGKAEAYWRHEAEKLRVRQQRGRDRIESLRSRMAAAETRTGPRSGEARARTATQVETWRAGIEALEARLREEDARFADRARRAGALPGWLR